MMTIRFFILALHIVLLASLTAGQDEQENFECPEVYEFDATVKGTVSSPFYGEKNYPNDLTCNYRISAPENHKIKITITDMDLDTSGPDILVVFGKEKKSVLGYYAGTNLPRPLLSNEGENEIILFFRTDFMVSGRGFLLEYESSPYLKLCEIGYIQCTNRKCYKAEQKCDGVDDCGDGTDEEDCGFKLLLQPEECGMQAILPITVDGSQDRIVGGEEAVPNSWPWQVSLQLPFSEPSGHFCGGTLINDQWVLTATHCVVGRPKPREIEIRVGAHSKLTRTKYEQIRRSARVVAFPDLELDEIKRYDLTHDISLVKLNAPVKFNDGVQPACLPEFGWALRPGWLCYSTGWGVTRGSGGSDVLKQAKQIVQSNSTCLFDVQAQICVDEYNQSPCHGDSGGPLNCKIGGKWYVFGATSYVTTTNGLSGLCSGPGAKSVFANSADKIDWIQKVINKYS